MTEPEVMLWSKLRGRSAATPTFRRQHPIHSIIVDFYCPSARLAVEVDGATHWDDEQISRDAARDRWLEERGVATMRIPASRIYFDLSGVVGSVLLRAEELIRQQGGRGPPPPPPALRLASSEPRRAVPLPPSLPRWGR